MITKAELEKLKELAGKASPNGLDSGYLQADWAWIGATLPRRVMKLVEALEVATNSLNYYQGCSALMGKKWSCGDSAQDALKKIYGESNGQK